MKLKQQGLACGEIAKRIAQHAVDAGCTDNVTIMIVDLHDYYLKYNKQNVLDAATIYLNWD
jgi:serine/threonine protein phosphatase PrpC